MKPILSGISLLALSIGTPTFSDDIFTDDISAQAGVCIGDDCVDDETFDLMDFDSQLRLKGSFLRIEFADISGSSSPDRDWAIRANEKGGGFAGEAFFIEDLTSDTMPFYIEGDTPDNTLYLSENGHVGIGTSMPSSELHLTKTFDPTVTYEATAFSGQIWRTQGGTNFFGISDSTAGTTPFIIIPGAPNSALVLQNNGNVGIGTSLPQAPLEVSDDETFSFFRITATGAAVNESVDITFTGGPLGTGQLRYNIVDGDNQEMSLDANGNMVLDGTLTTAGPTCAGGCDRVFDADYALPSIEQHSEMMFSAGHLPSVGPTLPDQPVNISEKMGGMLNALEHAHIYIAQQEVVISQLAQRLDATQQSQAAMQEELAHLRDLLTKH